MALEELEGIAVMTAAHSLRFSMHNLPKFVFRLERIQTFMVLLIDALLEIQLLFHRIQFGDRSHITQVAVSVSI